MTDAVDVLVAGDAAITFAWQLNAPPVPGRTSKLLGKVEPDGRFGGCAPAVALSLAGFQHRVALVSWLGDDAYGQAYLEELQRHGIDTTGVEVAAGQASARALMLYDPSGAATCLHHPSGSGRLRLPAAGLERLARSGWLALTAGPVGMTQALLDNRPAHTRIAWDVKADPNHYPVDLRRRILEEADLLCFNRDEVAFLTQSLPDGAGSAQEDQLRRLRGATRATLVLTDGPAGCRLIQSDETATIPAARIEVDDPTGVGDAFFAAFLSATMRGQPPRSAAEFATKQAADYLHNREQSA